MYNTCGANRNEKTILHVLFCILTLLSFPAKGHFQTDGFDAPERWERIAWSALEEKYKGAKLEDYEYLGRTQVNDEETKDVFRVTVNQEGKSFSAHAEVYFHPVTNAIINVNIFPL
ncbi:YqzG/YhdC family protein [Bacillus licheniformis]|uniref:YqzG/YhdC family protein n=1 Tax=Bacillus licheniformis TaxID=1402 RepID=UPI002E1AE45D|nr:YqzG/YhdC family protein [Bacillus licheniformis]